MLGLGLLAGPANVIMQLARPAVGYGVLESRVESGRVDRHPIKRARTTFTYLAVSTNGTPEQQKAFRRAAKAGVPHSAGCGAAVGAVLPRATSARPVRRRMTM